MRFLLPERSLYMNITPKQMLLYAVSDRAWSNSDEEFSVTGRAGDKERSYNIPAS